MISRTVPVILLVLTLGLIGLGLTVVYSASSNKAAAAERNRLKKSDPQAYEISHDYHGTKFLINQALYAGVGILALIGLSHFDHHRLRSAAKPLLVFSAILLLLVFVPNVGIEVNGAKRWINLRILRFQPSELAKLVMIIYMAGFLLDHQRHLDSFRKGLLPSLFVTGLMCAIIVVEPDFGAAFLLALNVFGLWFVAGMKKRHMFALASVVCPLAVVAVVTSPYRLKRIMEWLELLTQGIKDDRHISQSVLAVGTGGLHGRGLGNSIQKYAFLPEAHTDFIFAVMAEETGFIICIGFLVVLLTIVMLGWFVALRSADTFGGHLASGITLLFFLNWSINLMVVTGILPPKGLALPFISYGGSSMLINCAAMGILINVAKYNEQLVKASIPRRIRR